MDIFSIRAITHTIVLSLGYFFLFFSLLFIFAYRLLLITCFLFMHTTQSIEDNASFCLWVDILSYSFLSLSFSLVLGISLYIFTPLHVIRTSSHFVSLNMIEQLGLLVCDCNLLPLVKIFICLSV